MMWKETGARECVRDARVYAYVYVCVHVRESVYASRDDHGFIICCREYDNYIEGEQREMVELYSKKGMSTADAGEHATLPSSSCIPTY